MTTLSALDLAKASFARVWADPMAGDLPYDELMTLVDSNDPSPLALREDRAFFLEMSFRANRRHGHYRWVYELFTNPSYTPEQLAHGIEHHLSVHQNYRLRGLLPVHAEPFDGCELMGDLWEATAKLRRELGEFKTLMLSGEGKAQAVLQLEELRELLQAPVVKDLGEAVVARSLTVAQMKQPGVNQNLAVRLYQSWLRVVEICRPNELVAAAVSNSPAPRSGRLFFDYFFRTTLLSQIKPIALGFGIIFGGIALLTYEGTSTKKHGGQHG
ncbi:MAG: hypothetical protein HY542_07510 [Deltaproteobacteria bacterium]|nr:hypothetical protein [Deltaproteobacteria bacterium]